MIPVTSRRIRRRLRGAGAGHRPGAVQAAGRKFARARPFGDLMPTPRSLATAVLLAGALLGPSAALAQPVPPTVACTDDIDGTVRLDLPSGAFGFYALPAGPPRGLVVFAHGHGNSAYKWRQNLADTARNLGVIAVAMDFRGQTFPGGDITKSSFGWRVREGAEDSNDAGRLFERTCFSGTGTRPMVIYGVSMGGNASGLAVAAQPKRSDGTPLWDYWFDIEGVNNALETYLEARMVAGPPLNNATGQTAVQEFYEENGNRTFEEDPAAYADLAVVTHGQEIGAAGLKGVVMVHGFDDGTVPFNQTPEMLAVLVEERIPTDVFAVSRPAAGQEHGNTIEDTFGLPGRIPGYSSPFTGHGGENNLAHPVIAIGFERLARLLDDGRVPRCYHAWVYDEGAYTSDPEQQSLPDC